jgi:hypothetical protein
MTPCDLVLAAALLTSAPGIPEQPPTPDRWPGLQAALHKTAVEWEILDPRETRYVLARVEDYQADLDILRKRQVELADAPKVGDSARFPAREVVNEFIRFNRAYRKHLETRQVWEADRADVIRIVMAETDRLYRVWDAIRDARCEFYYITVRRQALQRLRDLIGPEAYAIGELPPHVPDSRFVEVK